MPYHDFKNTGEEITWYKVLENYKFLEYITTKKLKEYPSTELFMERRRYRASVSKLGNLLKKLGARKDSQTV